MVNARISTADEEAVTFRVEIELMARIATCLPASKQASVTIKPSDAERPLVPYLSVRQVLHLSRHACAHLWWAFSQCHSVKRLDGLVQANADEPQFQIVSKTKRHFEMLAQQAFALASRQLDRRAAIG